MELELTYFPDEILLKPCSHFENKSKADIVNLAYEMAKLMMKKNGIGIAAPQIGLNERIFVISPMVLNDQCKHTVFIDPEITWRAPDLYTLSEGCLSIPNEKYEVARPAEISIKATNIDGKEFFLEKIGGMLGRVLQHEYDHLEGLLINRFQPGK